MKKRFLGLLIVPALLLTSCTSANTEDDAKKFFEGSNPSAYKLDSQASSYSAKVEIKTADVWATSEDLSAATVAEYQAVVDGIYASLLAQTALATGVFSELTSTFALYNEGDKALAKKYDDEVEYLIEKHDVKTSYEGVHTFVAEDTLKFDNGAFAFSYAATYNANSLLESAMFVASFVQQVKDKNPAFMRTYKAVANLVWVAK